MSLMSAKPTPAGPSRPKEESIGKIRGAVDNPRVDPHTTAPFLSAFERPAPPEIAVANTKSAEKAARQAEKHRARNLALRSRLRTVIRKVAAAVSAGNKQAAEAGYREAVPVIDSLVNKQIIHRNKAGRHKSRLAARIRAMQ
jgi:small subunit ribosomal protein S20